MKKVFVPILLIAAIRFFATVSFTQIDISCPSNSDNKGTLEFSLFKWMGTYESTVYDSEPICAVKFEDYSDNETATVHPTKDTRTVIPQRLRRNPRTTLRPAILQSFDWECKH